MKVLLVTAPFGAIERPALGISLLKARLREEGVACDCAYLSLAFAHLFGRQRYERLVWDLPFRALVGEWVFTSSLYGGAAWNEDYIDHILVQRYGLSQDAIRLAQDARELAEDFLDDALASRAWDDYEVVGFSSYTAQNIASLALAKRVKERWPSVTTVFGGANWQGESGRELHRRFRFVDLVCQGEADDSFPALLRWLERGGTGGPDAVGGVLYRVAGSSRASSEAQAVRDLDRLPSPDFDDYYTVIRDGERGLGYVPLLNAETSRGCWWAATGPCGFCGMDERDREYRSKSPDRILRELRELTVTHAGSMLYLADTVVSHEFLRTVLPRLAERPLTMPIFMDVRPTVTREQVRLMSKARIQIQPGIESLSDHVLRLMHKGTRGLENVRLLKWCATYGVRVAWNLLYGFPGETQEDYDEMIAMMPAVRFLPAPGCCQTLSVDRYSPFFEQPQRHGFGSLTPLAPYKYLYPFPDDALRQIAYAFDYACAPGTTLPDVGPELQAQVTAWQREHGAGEVRLLRRAGGRVAVIDSRPRATARVVELSELDAALLAACEDICRRRDLAGAADSLPTGRVGEDELDEALRRLIAGQMMVCSGGRYLSLPLPDRRDI